MQFTSRTIRAVAVDLIVEETKSVGRDGRLLCYVAEIYIREPGGRRRFVRKTRLPETAEMLAASVQRRGGRALETFSTAP